MSFVFSCFLHGTALLEACQACGEPLAPHRSLGGRMENCHTCGHPYSQAHSESMTCSWLQDTLAAAFRGQSVGFMGVGVSSEDWLMGCRQALSILMHRQRLNRMAMLLGLQQEELPSPHVRYIEHMRLQDRRKALAMLERWLSRWPDLFLASCEAGCVTQRSFARFRQVPSWLEQWIGLLSVGEQRLRRKARPGGVLALRRAGGMWREHRAGLILQRLGAV